MLAPEVDVIEAACGQDALDVLATRSIDLVLLDVMMPDMSGFEVCRRAKTGALEFLPVLLLTALSDQNDRTAGLEAGADDFLSKPVDRRELVLRVRAFLRIRAQERTIARQLDDLRQLAALKDDLVSLIIHDLRNPLAGINGVLHLLGRELADVEHLELVRDAVSAADKLEDILEDLLQVRMLEEGQLVLRRESHRPRAIAEAAVGTLRGDALDRKVNVAVAGDSDATAPVDAKLLRRAIENLLSNALKYSQAGDRIDLEVTRAAGDIVVAVADRGPGVPAQQRDRLFQKFGAVAPGGLGRRSHGLGLYLVRLVVAAHGGRVAVEDRAGGGSVFRLFLPVQAAEEARPGA